MAVGCRHVDFLGSSGILVYIDVFDIIILIYWCENLDVAFKSSVF